MAAVIPEVRGSRISERWIFEKLVMELCSLFCKQQNEISFDQVARDRGLCSKRDIIAAVFLVNESACKGCLARENDRDGDLSLARKREN